jgi:beta-N-acetylhexosaminidase
MTGRLAAIFGCLGATISADEAAFFRDSEPFGFILFARNVENPAQLRALTADLRAAVGRDAPILIDQEGGRVQRLRPPHWRDWQPPLDTVARARDPARAMWLRSRLIAHELQAVGIDANCAPCADVATDATHLFLKNRCYGTEPNVVSHLSLAVAEGLLAGGILPVMKHLPGHGRATADTHHDLPTVGASRALLTATDFAPFRALSHLPMAMTAHVVFSAYDTLPATQSPLMIRAIRDEIGFQGLLMTDDLNMQALSGDLGARTAASMAAGCDIALHCNGNLAEMLAVAAHAGEPSPPTRARAQAALAMRRPPEPVDIPTLEAEFQAMMSGNAHG